jgi:acetylxylan esterase
MFLPSVLATLSIAVSYVVGASLTRVSSFGSNPTGMNMYIYVPDRLASSPAVVVLMHPCGGSAQFMYTYTKLPSYADQNGFIIVYPEAPHDSNCFDIMSSATQTHGAGGDSLAVASMVNYTISTYKADRARVFAAGSSSGGMMTNVMCAVYPDVFAAGAAFSGFTFGCHTGGGSSPGSADPACASGRVTHTAQEWLDILRKAYPSYTGTYPRMQIWSGTSDSVVSYVNFGEQLKQWGAAHSVSFARNVTNVPASGWTQTIYGDGTKVVGYTQQGGQHITPFNEDYVLRFFGIIGGSTTTTTTTTTTTSTSTTSGGTTTTTTTGPPETCTVAKWGQCGGQSYTGCKTCASGSTCTYSNPWYSQCL